MFSAPYVLLQWQNPTVGSEQVTIVFRSSSTSELCILWSATGICTLFASSVWFSLKKLVFSHKVIWSLSHLQWLRTMMYSRWCLLMINGWIQPIVGLYAKKCVLVAKGLWNIVQGFVYILQHLQIQWQQVTVVVEDDDLQLQGPAAVPISHTTE